MRNPGSVIWLLYGHAIGCQGNIRRVNIWQDLRNFDDITLR